eukprot:366433-Chlamydomonas_euryale.AAC.15
MVGGVAVGVNDWRCGCQDEWLEEWLLEDDWRQSRDILQLCLLRQRPAAPAAEWCSDRRVHTSAKDCHLRANGNRKDRAICTHVCARGAGAKLFSFKAPLCPPRPSSRTCAHPFRRPSVLPVPLLGRARTPSGAPLSSPPLSDMWQAAAAFHCLCTQAVHVLTSTKQPFLTGHFQSCCACCASGRTGGVASVADGACTIPQPM